MNNSAMSLVVARYLCNQVIAEDRPTSIEEGVQGVIQRLIDSVANPDLNVEAFANSAHKWLKRYGAEYHFSRPLGSSTGRETGGALPRNYLTGEGVAEMEPVSVGEFACIMTSVGRLSPSQQEALLKRVASNINLVNGVHDGALLRAIDPLLCHYSNDDCPDDFF